ncbi:hypothetical protein TNCV_1615631 [Trichonephila clavipes]|nr:hypothetical protein TNCV_1615631 [Trichonephila clavipes]
MRKIGGLTQHRHVASKKQNDFERRMARFIWSRSVTSEGIPCAIKPFQVVSAARVVPKPVSMVETHDAPRHRIVSMHFPIVNHVNHFTYTSATRGVFKSTLYASVM